MAAEEQADKYADERLQHWASADATFDWLHATEATKEISAAYLAGHAAAPARRRGCGWTGTGYNC